MTTSIPTVPLTLRVPPDLKTRVEDYARDQRISINASGVELLTRGLDTPRPDQDQPAEDR